MKQNPCLILSTSPPAQTGGKPLGLLELRCRRRLPCRGMGRMPAGKELDSETGLYYYGARYLDPKTGRWLSGDPAVGDYIPSAPVNDEARKRNGSLPGMGGVFNVVNLHVYHYAGNNPVKYVDPDGMWKIYSIFNFDTGKNEYFMTTPKTSTQIMRTIGVFFPGGTYLSNMQNGLINLSNRITVTNFMVEYDSHDTKGFDGVNIAKDLLSLTPVGAASASFGAVARGLDISDSFNKGISWNMDFNIQTFLNGITFNLFGGVEDREAAIALGYAIAFGASVYKKMNLKDMNISENTWAMAIKNKILGGNDSTLNNLYNEVMARYLND